MIYIYIINYKLNNLKIQIKYKIDLYYTFLDMKKYVNIIRFINQMKLNVSQRFN